jgi:transcriptional regulator of acetoin/glycerol metabolism
VENKIHDAADLRERQNYVARGVILSTNEVFEFAQPDHHDSAPLEIANPTLEDKIRQEILSARQRANWKLGRPRGAAARLGLKRTTLFDKMKRLGIEPPADGQDTGLSARRYWRLQPAGTNVRLR